MNERRFARSTNGVLFGVCGGLAEMVNLDPWLMRILWVLLGVFTQLTAVVAYVILAAVMKSPEGAPEGERFWHNVNGNKVIMIVAMLLIFWGVFIILDAVLHINLWKYLFPVGLIVGGGLLLAIAFKGKGDK